MDDAAPPEVEVTNLGRSAAVGAIVLWSTGNVLIKDVDLPGVQLAFWRLVIGSLIYVAILLLMGGRLRRRALVVAAPTGVIFTVQIALFFTALKSTTVASATVIGALTPLVLLFVASRRFGERIDPVAVGAGAVALGGVVVVVLGSSASTGEWSLRGDLFAVGAMLAFAAYFVAAKSARVELGAFELQTMAVIVGAVVLAPVAFIDAGGVDPPSLDEWFWVLVVLAIPGSGHLLMNWSHRYTHLTFTSMLTLAVPALSATLAAVWLGETLEALQIGGIVLVVAALAVVVRRDVAEPELSRSPDDP